MKLADFPHVQEASVQGKIDWVDEILASIPSTEVQPLESHLRILESRMLEYENAPESALTPEKARERLRELTGH